MKPEHGSDFYLILSDPKNKEYKRAVVLMGVRAFGVLGLAFGTGGVLGTLVEGDVISASLLSFASTICLILVAKSVIDMNNMRYK